MQASPHLAFNGQCRSAFRFYEQCLGSKCLMMMTYADSPMASQTPPEQRDKVMHASLAVGNTRITGADAPPGQCQTPQAASILLDVDTPAEADRVFAALSANGAVRMPIQETFWATRFGALLDQFGISWMINCVKPTYAPQEARAAR